MAGWLRLLGTATLVLGLVVAALTGWQVVGDEEFRRVAEAYARHPDHALFQTEYWSAAVRHYALVAVTAGGLVGGLVIGSVLLALGQLVRHLPPR